MARRQAENRTLRESVLDRLIDHDPHREQDDPQSENQVMRAVQASIRRDVENLLNTRYRCEEWPPKFDSLDDSLVNYGLPDFTAAGLNLVTDDEILIQSVKDALNRFEPRLVDVRVERIRGGVDFDRTFRFRILATLRLDSVEQEVRFDSSMETLTGQIEIG